MLVSSSKKGNVSTYQQPARDLWDERGRPEPAAERVDSAVGDALGAKDGRCDDVPNLSGLRLSILMLIGRLCDTGTHKSAPCGCKGTGADLIPAIVISR